MRRDEAREWYRSQIRAALRDREIMRLEELADRINRSRASLSAYLQKNDPTNRVLRILDRRRKRESRRQAAEAEDD